MNTKESTKSWIFILLFMMATAIIAAIWPTLTGGNSGLVAVPNETVYVEVPLLGNTVAAPTAMAAMAAMALVLILIIGAGITIIFTLIAKFIRKEKESDSYAKNRAALTAKEKQALVAKGKARVATATPNSTQRKWPTWGTAILALFLVGSLSIMASRFLWPPTGVVLVNGEIVTKGANFTMFTLSATAVILAVFLRPSYVNNIDKTDHNSAPWALYWIIFLGAVVIALNFGYMLYANSL